ncbi:MAG: CDP-diacylglycerol--glycerol-3-phosphate 3-phosphatidyltransferase [Deltaproteobacteria bacterium]|nr:CDP-diacylglycerol--glycerol-3-phosphate 3-phosphatidyltransferase [Deltaproteobacteria bacterium]MBW2679005.1 CDP-diacylglycerol--glycerol-3-phosphate 3-phosphatidyltransferase [Deltaproteobacteria bacterium]
MLPRDKIKQKLSEPNTLTMGRVAAIPLIVILLYYPNRVCTFLAALIFSAAAITDYLDGYLARTRGLESTFGKIMDPVADKLLVSSSFIMLVYHGWIPAWVVCIIIGRELAVTGLRNIIAEKGEDVSASWLGKYKTGFQIAAMIPLIFHYPYFSINLHAVGMFFLWGALAFTLWSGADYFFKARHLFNT